MSKRKRLVYVPEDLLKEVMKVARSMGKSLGYMVEESLKQAVSASQLGYTPKRVEDLLEVTHAHRVLGGTFVPQDILNHLVSLAYEDEEGRRALQGELYKSGSWHGKYLKEKFENPVQTFKAFLEATRWDLIEVEVKQEGDAVKLRCISTVLTREGTELLQKYVEGAMHGIGYKTTKKDCMKGMIILEFGRQCNRD